MKYLTLSVLLLFSNLLSSQNKTKTKNEDELTTLLNAVSEGLKQNPQNPLKLDKEFFNSFTSALPEGE